MRYTLKAWILRIHKWIGIGLGVILFVWLVSGIVMILPPPALPKSPAQPIDFRSATVSPAQAAGLIAGREGDTAAPRKVGIVGILGRSYYLVETGGGRSHLIDAESGATLRITPDLAEQIARRIHGAGTTAATVTEMRRHDAAYLGPLPAYRVDFADEARSSVIVSPRDGSARYTTQATRTRFVISNLHTFDHLKLLPSGEPLRKPLLYLTSLIGVALVLTGYYMVLPRSWRLKRSAS